MTVRQKKQKVVEFPSLDGFSHFFKSRAKLADTLSSTIADVYEWSTNLQPSPDNLPLPFVSQNDEVIWSYLKHQNRQLDVFHRKYKGVLDELSGKEHIEVETRKRSDVEEDDDEDDEEEENEDEDDIEDEEDEIEDEEIEVDDEDEEEEEGDVDLFNLKESDLKNLDADLKAMQDEDDDDEQEEDAPSTPAEPKKYRKSVVDDAFFSLEEMNDFLNKTEKVGGAGQEEMMFEDEDNWDGKTTYTYEDFFGSRQDVEDATTSKSSKTPTSKKRKVVEDPPSSGKKRVRFAMDEEDEDEQEPEEEVEDEENGPILLGADVNEQAEETGYAKKQKKMKQQIAKLEEENLAPRTWELSGEVAADQREKNTLLEQHVDFDHGAKRAPEVTEEFTDKLEELIKQRIRDKAFDDVVRVKKIENKGARFETEALENIHNQKTTLTEVYEKEYQDKIGAEGGEQKTVVNEAHEKITTKMSELFKLIDALTHFEYRPAEARDDIKIVSNMSALRVEEVGAMASSEGQLMAPEEVSKKMKAAENMKGDEERDRTDKLRERRKKKSKQRALVEKMGEERVFGEQKAAKLAKKKAKEGGNEKAEKIKSSNFFSKLQDTVQQEKKDGAKTKKKVIKRVKTDKNSAAIKL